MDELDKKPSGRESSPLTMEDYEKSRLMAILEESCPDHFWFYNWSIFNRLFEVYGGR